MNEISCRACFSSRRFHVFASVRPGADRQRWLSGYGGALRLRRPGLRYYFRTFSASTGLIPNGLSPRVGWKYFVSFGWLVGLLWVSCCFLGLVVFCFVFVFFVVIFVCLFVCLFAIVTGLLLVWCCCFSFGWLVGWLLLLLLLLLLFCLLLLLFLGGRFVKIIILSLKSSSPPPVLFSGSRKISEVNTRGRTYKQRISLLV